MEENKVVEQEVVEEKTEETNAEEKKTEVKETKKAKKAEKASVGTRMKNWGKRNRKPIIAGIGGFVGGAASAVFGSMWLGHRQRQAEAMALRETPAIPDDYNSPLDPNVE